MEKQNKNNIDFMSSTMFEAYLTCPYSFKIDFIDKQKHLKFRAEDEEQIGDNKYAACGRELHDLFEEYSLKDEKTIEEMINSYIVKFETIPNDLFDSNEDRDIFYKRDLIIINNWFNQEQECPKPLFTEKQHFVQIHDDLPPIRVTIDRINGDIEHVDEWIVEDYKTGKVYAGDKLRYNLQMPIYALAIKQLYGHIPQTLRLRFPQHNCYREFNRINDDVYRCIVPRGKTYNISLKTTLKTMINIYNKIKNGHFSPNPKNEFFCNTFCQYGISGECKGVSTHWDLYK